MILVIGICRNSRCSLILFSVVGLFGIIVCWLLSGIYLASTVAVGDFCMQPTIHFCNKLAGVSMHSIMKIMCMNQICWCGRRGHTLPNDQCSCPDSSMWVNTKVCVDSDLCVNQFDMCFKTLSEQTNVTSTFTHTNRVNKFFWVKSETSLSQSMNGVVASNRLPPCRLCQTTKNQRLRLYWLKHRWIITISIKSTREW